MRGKSYSPEIRQDAEDLYVEDGITYEEVAGRTGISEHTIKHWGGEDDWPGLRREYLQAHREINRNLRKLRQSMMKKAVDSDRPDPQDIYAIIRLEQLAHVRERKAESHQGGTDIDRPRLFLEDMEFVAEILKEIDPEGLKTLAKNFEIIVHRFKEKYEKAA